MKKIPKKEVGKKKAIKDLPTVAKGAKNVKGGAMGGDDDLEDLEVERLQARRRP